LTGTTTVAASGGIATFSNLSVNKSGTSYTLIPSSTGLTAATSSGFDITAAVASKLAVAQQPISATAGASISPAVTVQILDSNNNLVTTSSANVAIAIGANPGGGSERRRDHQQ
jgi:hypothetical protein